MRLRIPGPVPVGVIPGAPVRGPEKPTRLQAVQNTYDPAAHIRALNQGIPASSVEISWQQMHE
jgi:hypothetical protein